MLLVRVLLINYLCTFLLYECLSINWFSCINEKNEIKMCNVKQLEVYISSVIDWFKCD